MHFRTVTYAIMLNENMDANTNNIIHFSHVHMLV